jgi:galacturan 1,4-alpha-galacturonidase
MEVRLKGNLLALTDLGRFSTNWVEFQYIKGLKVAGGGTLNAQGASAWPQNECPNKSQCKTLPTVSKLTW